MYPQRKKNSFLLQQGQELHYKTLYLSFLWFASDDQFKEIDEPVLIQLLLYKEYHRQQAFVLFYRYQIYFYKRYFENAKSDLKNNIILRLKLSISMKLFHKSHGFFFLILPCILKTYFNNRGNLIIRFIHSEV